MGLLTLTHSHFSHSGDYPEEIKTRVLRKTHDTGFRKSRLPTLTDEEVNFIRGTFDFLGLNSYTTRIVEHRECHVNEEETRKYQSDSAKRNFRKHAIFSILPM